MLNFLLCLDKILLSWSGISGMYVGLIISPRSIWRNGLASLLVASSMFSLKLITGFAVYFKHFLKK